MAKESSFSLPKHLPKFPIHKEDHFVKRSSSCIRKKLIHTFSPNRRTLVRDLCLFKCRFPALPYFRSPNYKKSKKGNTIEFYIFVTIFFSTNLFLFSGTSLRQLSWSLPFPWLQKNNETMPGVLEIHCEPLQMKTFGAQTALTLPAFLALPNKKLV